MSNRIVVLGAGESGTGAAVLAKLKGFDVFVSDKGQIKQDYRQLLRMYEIPFEAEKHTEELILNADEVIKSPGIPEKADIIKHIREKNISIISEIEFAARYTNSKLICITGSNGKTTTVNLIYKILKDAGLNVGLAGNVGKSFAMQVAHENYEYYVIELSSFQLDDMFEFRANIAILLNITPDHLDRYNYDVNNYIASKFRIIQNQQKDDVFIYCKDDDLTMKNIEKFISDAIKYPFSLEPHGHDGAFINGNKLNVITDNTQFTMNTEDISIKGKHNLYNSMAASIAARVLHIRKENIRQSLIDFKGVEHRLEAVVKVRSIEFINDSKATNVNSAWYALESMTKPVVWIAGGVDKGNEYSELFELARKKVKALVCLGVDNEKLKKSFEGVVSIIDEAGSMEEAVRKAYRLADKGDVVLLSPCCASFDLFKNYEDRGLQFKECVRSL